MTDVIDFKHESASCQIIIWDDGTASLANVYATERRKGHTSVLLDQVMNWIDERGIFLKTAAEAHGPEPKMPQSLLIVFYKKFGFVPLDDITENYVYMERPSK
jgi:GNAT superfamily N-acetyltransferase